MKFPWQRRKVTALSDDETKLGMVLVRMGVCNADQIDYAEDRKASRKLGEALVDLDMCGKDDVRQAMIFQEQLRNGKAAHALLAIRRSKADQRKEQAEQASQRLSISQLKATG